MSGVELCIYGSVIYKAPLTYDAYTIIVLSSRAPMCMHDKKCDFTIS